MHSRTYANLTCVLKYCCPYQRWLGCIHTALLQHSDDDSTWTDLVQADIVNGTIAAGGIWLKLDGTTDGDPGTTGGDWQVGYVGGNRYLRLVLAKTGTHTNGTPISGVIVKSRPRVAPKTNTVHNA